INVAKVTTLSFVKTAAQPEAGRAVFQAIKPRVKSRKRFNSEHTMHVIVRLRNVKNLGNKIPGSFWNVI
ncbi:hypothetical protein KAI46_05820, partial [bacterium]|nr:hypothetical protein [bacterium]